METITITSANAMPAPTWHRLRVNDAVVEIPGGLDIVDSAKLEGDERFIVPAGAFESAIAGTRVRWEEEHPPVEPVVDDADAGAWYGGTAYSEYQRKADEAEASRDLARMFETGMGDEAFDVMRSLASEVKTVFVPRGAEAHVALRVDGVDGAIDIGALDLVAAEDSRVELVVTADSASGAGTGVTGSSIRVFAGPRARVSITRVQTLADGFTDLDDLGLFVDDDAVVDVRQAVLGAGRTYTGFAGDLRGDRSRVTTDTRYLGHDDQVHDLNYVIRHHGRQSECAMNANGVLSGRSQKTYRGTIDLVRGCKGSVGNEKETVLLVDEGVVNKTVPVILCNEDDVVGNHGATIGHVRPDQMFYLASRGLDKRQAEHMFLRSMLEEAALTAPDERAREGVVRLGMRLVDDFGEVL